MVLCAMGVRIVLAILDHDDIPHVLYASVTHAYKILTVQYIFLASCTK
jgi:hypothetical protein